MGSKAYKPTLGNTRKLLEVLDNPQDKLSFIHVAGSNGKGSVCSMIAASLTQVGYTIGLFTSPHIVDFTERIRVNGQQIDEESVINFVNKIRNAKLDFEPSFFEMSFALSLIHFETTKCDLCVIETGLGGRLDSTNVISPILSVITGISMEHTNILGDTLEKIAGEKAGIIKHQLPVILGVGCDPMKEVFERKAEEMNTHILPLAKKVIPEGFPLLGEYQRDNFQTASTVLNYLDMIGFENDQKERLEAMNNIRALTGYSGRLQIVSRDPLTIVDVAHNPEGLKATYDTIRKEFPHQKYHVILGASSDKNLGEMLDIFEGVEQIYLTEFTNDRSATKEELQSITLERLNRNITVHSHLNEALEIVNNEQDKNKLILITGSFFLLSDFF